jgi:hypothetical protein
MKHVSRILFASILAPALAPTMAWAETPAATADAAAGDARPAVDEPPQAEAPAARDGFVLRMSTGVAALGATLRPKGGSNFEMGGGGAAINVMLGEAVTPHLVLHADLLAVGTDDAPRGCCFASGDRSAVDSIGLAAAGVGATYFVLPQRLSFTGSLMYAVAGFDQGDGQSFAMNRGVLGKLAIGKEWSISRRWDLGIEGALLGGYGRGRDESKRGFDAGIGGASLSLVATFD